jgi:hypothetical protein
MPNARRAPVRARVGATSFVLVGALPGLAWSSELRGFMAGVASLVRADPGGSR